MSAQEILYVAFRDEPLDEGISYAIYLSKLLSEPLRIVLLSRDIIEKEKFDNQTAADTHSEADKHETANGFLSGDVDSKDAVKIQNYLIAKCEADDIKATVHIGLDATISVVTSFLQQKKVDLVLLSPEVTKNQTIQKKLVKFSQRPLVTMAPGNNLTNS